MTAMPVTMPFARGALPVIPTRRGANTEPERAQKYPAPTRAKTVRAIRKLGRAAWKTTSGYHRRSLAETAMGRLKAIFGAELKSRKLTRQQSEIDINVDMLNQFAQIAMPVSIKIA